MVHVSNVSKAVQQKKDKVRLVMGLQVRPRVSAAHIPLPCYSKGSSAQLFSVVLPNVSRIRCAYSGQSDGFISFRAAVDLGNCRWNRVRQGYFLCLLYADVYIRGLQQSVHVAGNSSIVIPETRETNTLNSISCGTFVCYLLFCLRPIFSFGEKA